MFHYYIQSFNLRFEGRASRQEFWSVAIIDILILAIMNYTLCLLKCPEQLPLTSLSAVFEFFQPYRHVICIICFGWLSARYAAWQAVGVRRFHDVGLEDKWVLNPFVNPALLIKGQQGKNEYGEDPCEKCKK